MKKIIKTLVFVLIVTLLLSMYVSAIMLQVDEKGSISIERYDINSDGTIDNNDAKMLLYELYFPEEYGQTTKTEDTLYSILEQANI